MIDSLLFLLRSKYNDTILMCLKFAIINNFAITAILLKRIQLGFIWYKMN